MSKCSIAWDHFDVHPVDNSKATCRHCDTTVSRGGRTPATWSTSTLTKHLTCRHPFINLTKPSKDGSSSSQSQQPQPDIKASFDKGKAWEFSDSRSLGFHRAVAEMIALDDQPFSFLVNNVGFRRLIKLVGPCYMLPSDTYLRQTAIPDSYKHLHEKVA